jgi:hypothetical protein
LRDSNRLNSRMIAPPVNLVDAVALDDQVINSLASQLSRGAYQREVRLLLALIVTGYLLASKRQSPGQRMQNLKPMDGVCALAILLPAAAPFFPGKLIPGLRLSLHLAVLSGICRSGVAYPAAERTVVTEYMYRLLALQSFTGAISALAPLTAFLRRSGSASGCVVCGRLAMIQPQVLRPCGHSCCYACVTQVQQSCPRCSFKLDSIS